MNSSKLEFGLNVAVPAEAAVAWGARAIYRSSQKAWDIPYDRKDTFGDKAAVAKMLEALQKDKALDKALKQWHKNDVSDRDQEIHTLYIGAGFVIKGSCMGSCGYIYLAAFPNHEFWNKIGQHDPETAKQFIKEIKVVDYTVKANA